MKRYFMIPVDSVLPTDILAKAILSGAPQIFRDLGPRLARPSEPCVVLVLEGLDREPCATIELRHDGSTHFVGRATPAREPGEFGVDPFSRQAFGG